MRSLLALKSRLVQGFTIKNKILATSRVRDISSEGEKGLSDLLNSDLVFTESEPALLGVEIAQFFEFKLNAILFAVV